MPDMIDMHCHILPGIDDGARDLSMALEMAHAAVEDGVRAIVCTPHITPGIYDNNATGINQAVSEFAWQLEQNGIDLPVYVGADIRITPDMGKRILDGQWPSIAGTRYFLFEPDHNVLTPGILELAEKLLRMKLVPVLTHPERLRWLDGHYDLVWKMWNMGCVIQITAGALTGRFGKQPQSWAHRMLKDGLVDVIATDAHNMHRRPPLLHEGYEAAATIIGKEYAWAMVYDNPLTILENRPLLRKSHKRFKKKDTAGKKHGSSLLGSLKRLLSLR